MTDSISVPDGGEQGNVDHFCNHRRSSESHSGTQMLMVFLLGAGGRVHVHVYDIHVLVRGHDRGRETKSFVTARCLWALDRILLH